MGQDSKIEWTHHTFNSWRGCTKVSDGCKFCYAETLSGRNPAVLGVWGVRGSRVIASEAMWAQPVKWNREAEKAGERRRVFCASLADVFECDDTMPAESRGAVREARTRLMETIDNTPYLDWLLLTKRPQNVMAVYSALYTQGRIQANVWIGTSVENQATADERIPHLLQIPAKVRFLSCEPLLGAVDLRNWLPCGCTCANAPGECSCHGVNGNPGRRASNDFDAAIDWVIAGGESGANARPMHPDWARGLRDQCVEAGVPFLFKQWGAWHESESPADSEFILADGDRLVNFRGEDFGYVSNASHSPRDGRLTGCTYSTTKPLAEQARWIAMRRVGKHAAGRLLDGREWNQYPEAQP